MINWIFLKNCSYLLKTSQILDRFFSLPEIEEYQKFKIQKRKSEWLASRLLVKRLIANVFSDESTLPLASICVHKEVSGVPFVEITGIGRIGWLSISHSSEGVLAAFSSDESIRFGVDLELIEPRPLDLFADFFTPSEITWLSSYSYEKRDLLSNIVWSAKEAFLKAIEKGLQMDTRKIIIQPFEIVLIPRNWYELKFSVDGVNTKNWQLFFAQEQGYVMTICQPKHEISKLVEINDLPID